MKYFAKVAEGLHVVAALDEVRSRITECDGVDGYALHTGARRDPDPAGLKRLGHTRFPNFPAVDALYRAAQAALGNPTVARAWVRILPPRSVVAPHRDALPGHVRRHHVVLQDDGAVFTIKRERCRFKPGEVWRVDLGNRLHGVANETDRERVVLLIDTVAPSRSPAPEAA